MKQIHPVATSAFLGFTLIELLVALVVLAILLTIGVPSFANLIANNRATTAANELLGALQYARSEAVRQNNTLTICSSGNESECAGSRDWHMGWVVRWQDAPIRVKQSFNPSVMILGPEVDGDEIRFGSAGQVLRGDGQFTVTVTGGVGAIRNVCLQVSGRAFVGGCQ